MAVYWVLEPVHLTMTALLPVVLMPMLGILSEAEVTSNYMKEVLMMYLGGLAVAVAVEHCNLHERLALKVLLLLGTDTKWRNSNNLRSLNAERIIGLREGGFSYHAIGARVQRNSDASLEAVDRPTSTELPEKLTVNDGR
ncbi:hypothetical protein TNCV_1438901 [Trichonephila clavipes]|nr:hypothetical protein TNCV_1438901 [Trichonephila clavipes]